MSWRGTLRREAVEGGVWVLETPRGRFVLLGPVDRGLEGAQVEVDGEEVESFGLAMMGPQIEVRRVRPV